MKNKTIFGIIGLLLISLLLVGAVTNIETLLPGQQKTYKLVDYFDKDKDCLTRRVGGKNIVMCDASMAFDKIFADVNSGFLNFVFDWLGYSTKTGSKIELPAQTMWLSHEVRFCRQFFVSGVSGGQGGATVFYVPKANSAFKNAYFDECVAAKMGEGGVDSVFENFSVFEATGPTLTSVPNHGFLMENRSQIRNVLVFGFVQGIRISADHNRTPRSNANGWKLENVEVSNTEHAGIYVDGGDANAGLALAPNVVSGCQRGSYWKASLGPCADHVYSDFIGSTIIAAQASGSFDTTTKENFPNYLFEGDSQRAICIGCYSESDAVPPILARYTMWLGSTAMAGVGGFKQVGGQISGLTFVNDKDPKNKVTVSLGTNAAPGTGFEMTSSGGALTQTFRIKADPTKKSITMNMANLSSGDALRIGATVDAPGSWGGVTIPREVNFGNGATIPMNVSTGTPAASLCSLAAQGSIVFEKKPKSKGPVGYQCTDIGWRSWR